MLNYAETACSCTIVPLPPVPCRQSQQQSTEPLPFCQPGMEYVRWFVSAAVAEGYQAAQHAYQRMEEEDEYGALVSLTGYEYAHLARQYLPASLPSTVVKSAYSSQECQNSHSVDKANRLDQQTFCCLVCGYSTHADLNAAKNIERRVGDSALHLCKDRQAVKALLMQRHEAWRKQHNGWP